MGKPKKIRDITPSDYIKEKLELKETFIDALRTNKDLGKLAEEKGVKLIQPIEGYTSDSYNQSMTDKLTIFDEAYHRTDLRASQALKQAGFDKYVHAAFDMEVSSHPYQHNLLPGNYNAFPRFYSAPLTSVAIAWLGDLGYIRRGLNYFFVPAPAKEGCIGEDAGFDTERESDLDFINACCNHILEIILEEQVPTPAEPTREDTGMLDDNRQTIFLGDTLRSQWGYNVIVHKDDDGEYYGKLFCRDDHSCKNIPYSLGGGKGHVKVNDWIPLNQEELPQHFLILEFFHPELGTIEGYLIETTTVFNDRRTVSVWVHPSDHSADIWVGDFTHYRKLYKPS